MALASAKQKSRADVASLLSKSGDLRQRLWFVLVALLVYRLGTHVPLPGIDAAALAQYQDQLKQGLFGMFNMFSGGALSRMTIFALNVMPYITASIIMQLMTTMSPAMNEMKKEGESGRRRITQYTRYLTVVLAFLQGLGLATGMESVTVGNAGLQVVVEPGMMFRLQTALTLMTGTIFLMWLGDQITKKGIGQGISIIIFAGIVAELPRTLFQTFELARIGSLSAVLIGFFVLMILAVLAFCVFVETSYRKVLVQYPKRQIGPNKMTAGDSTHMPLKLNTAGVIPPIFASSLLLFPASIASFAPNSQWAQMLGSMLAPGQPLHMLLFVALIVFFCFFYTAIVFNPEETAENLKSQGGFIPGVRPGKSTAQYFDWILSRLTVLGAAYISFVCVLPEFLNSQMSVPFYFGGTSVLIVVSVTIDVVGRIQTHLIAQRYESMMKRTKLRGRARG